MDYGLQTFGRETDFEKYQYILDYKKVCSTFLKA